MFFTQTTLFITFLLFSQLAPSSPLPADAQAPLMQQQPEARNALDDAVIAANSPQYLINKMEANKNVTCKASDTACVMGKSGPTQKRDDEHDESIPEFLEAPVNKRQFASSIQDAAANAGINDLQKPNTTSSDNSTSTSTSSSTPTSTKGICRADDTKCVVGARDAIPESQAEADFDPIAVRISELQAELEDIRAKRDQHLVKRQAAATPTSFSSSTTSTSSSSTITASSTLSSNGTESATTSFTSSSTSSTGTALPRTTNAFGRIVCKASDTECVTGAS